MMPILCDCYTSIPPPRSQRINKQSNTKQTIPKQAKTAARTATKINLAPNETTNIEEVDDGDGNGNHDEREHITNALRHFQGEKKTSRQKYTATLLELNVYFSNLFDSPLPLQISYRRHSFVQSDSGPSFSASRLLAADFLSCHCVSSPSLLLSGRVLQAKAWPSALDAGIFAISSIHSTVYFSSTIVIDFLR